MPLDKDRPRIRTGLIFFVSKTDFNHQKIKNQMFDQDLKNLVQDRPVVQKRNLLFHQKNDWFHHHRDEKENQIKMKVIRKVKKKMKILQNRKNKR